MWRYDANRSAASPHDLPNQLELQWTRTYNTRQQVWDDPLNHDLMPYDQVFEPVVVGKTIFLPFNDTDKLVALDTDRGTRRWTFYTDGPIRLPPATTADRIYFASDDGRLYCVDTDNGQLVWKHRGGPSARKVLGNKRLISAWPARGGPVIVDTELYYAASIWPFMGTFIYALDAATGSTIWLNDRSGSNFIQQPHNSPSFAGIAPQGALVAAGDRLLVPGGRSVPAAFNRHSGEQLYYHLANHGKSGGSSVYASGDRFFGHERGGDFTMFDVADGDRIADMRIHQPVVTPTAIYTSGEKVQALDAADLEQPRWQIEADATGDLIKVGRRLYAGGAGRVTIIEESDDQAAARIVTTIEFEGTVGRLLAGDDKLFVITTDGALLTYGGTHLTEPPNHWKHQPTENQLSQAATDQAAAILDSTGVRSGYALFYGVADGDLLEAIVRQSDLHVIAVDRDAAKVDRLRRRYDEAGLYGSRIAVHQGDPDTFMSPPYLASLTIMADPQGAGFTATDAFATQIYHSMRPYGGKAWLVLTGEQRTALRTVLRNVQLPGARVADVEGGLLVERRGSLRGAADWTHLYGNIANTVKSDDQLVKLPLGVLWFGGSSNMDVLPRHGHGPPEQIIGGRYFIQGIDSLSARDVYTGRVLWKVAFDGSGNFGVYYDDTYHDSPLSTSYNQVHIAGANARGVNYVATEDHVYILQGPACHVLDAATGQQTRLIQLPAPQGAPPPTDWGYIGIYQQYLIGGADFTRYDPAQEGEPDGALDQSDRMASNALIIMDLQTGDERWRIDATHGLLHNAIIVGNDTLFCLDKLPPFVEARLQRRGEQLPAGYRLRALHIDTGEVKWETASDVFGSWLSYSQPHDVLLQSTRPSRDMIAGEGGQRMIAYQGHDGSIIWDKPVAYGEPPILHGERIISGGQMFELLTGEPVMRRDPLTGEQSPWSYGRGYGCNYAIASEHLLTFRAAAAGFYDLTRDGGTGHFGGFRAGCTASLVAANGVLNAPDYTRTCTCSYQNQTSLALVHMPDLEVWTHNDFAYEGKSIRQIGINFGAAGDRRSDNGTLWLDHPSVGGPSPQVPIEMTGDPQRLFRMHSLRMQDGLHRWIGASGLEGVHRIKVRLRPGPSDDDAPSELPTIPYTVRLFFAEPELDQPGARVFDVCIQGNKFLEQFDVFAAADGRRKVVVRQFDAVAIADHLELELTPITGDTLLNGLEIVAE